MASSSTYNCRSLFKTCFFTCCHGFQSLQFFNNTLVIGKHSESDVADRIYDLILELHGIDPTLLLSVLSQLEYKLKVQCALYVCCVITVHII